MTSQCTDVGTFSIYCINHFQSVRYCFRFGVSAINLLPVVIAMSMSVKKLFPSGIQRDVCWIFWPLSGRCVKINILKIFV